jgi:predicted O-linked N-acetylglucosamine transferase (SPINDLY family)/GT2 family glycosyltransferase
MPVPPSPLDRARALYHQGQAGAALALLEPLLQGPDQPDEALGLVVTALLALGRLDQAEHHLRQALTRHPDDPGALNDLGMVLLRGERHDEAAEILLRAQTLAPADAGVCCNLAAARSGQGRTVEAVELYEQALALNPHLPQAHNNLANLHRSRGLFEQAEAGFRRAIQLNPRFRIARHNLADLLQERGRSAEAIALGRETAELDPTDGVNLSWLARALQESGRLDEAFSLAQQAAQHTPEVPEPWNQLGNLHQARGGLGEAESCYRRAKGLRPGWSVPWYNLGVCLLAQGYHGEAGAVFDEALRLAPDDAVAHATAVGALHFDPARTPAEVRAAHEAWADRHAPLRAVLPHDNSPEPERRLRIGYLSPDFRNHAVAFFLGPVLAAHDPESFEVFCYAEVLAPDAVTGWLRARSRHWRTTVGLSDDELARQIRNDRIDLLVDLGGHTAGSRLRALAARPAPVQVSWLGYPGTTGMAAIDYRLSDPVADPPGSEQDYTERLIRLPGCFCCYQPAARQPRDSALPEERQGVVTFGSLNKLDKLNDAVVRLWCAVLAEVPGSRLLLVRNTLRGPVVGFWRERFAEAGLAPDRLFIETVEPVDQAHLRAYERIDAALDPFPFGGHTTACEALSQGVPVVSLRGDRYAGRMVASLLHALGLPELVADSSADYVGICRELAADRQRRAELRAGLRSRLLTSPLGDGPGFTRSLEAVYRRLWRDWCDGHRPDARPPDPGLTSTSTIPLAEVPSMLRYLIGPIHPERAWLWPALRETGQAVTIGTEDSDVAVCPGDDWEQIAVRLPAGREPDVLLLDLDQTEIPPALWQAPLPVVALAFDWRRQWHALRRLAPHCELVLTDREGVEVLRRQGVTHARAVPLSAFDPAEWVGDLPEEERDLDLLVVLDPLRRYEHPAWLGLLPALAERWRLRVALGDRGEDSRALLRRARVVIAQSPLDPADLLASGCLLFRERNHAPDAGGDSLTEESAVLRDGLECVGFDTGDLGALLERHLGEESRRRQLVEAGRQRLWEFSPAAVRQNLLDLIERELPALRERRSARPAWGNEEFLQARTWQVLSARAAVWAEPGSVRPPEADPGLPADLAAALLDRPGEANLHDALGVLLIRPKPDGRVSAEEARLAAPHFQRAVTADPLHPVAALNLVECLTGLEQTEMGLQGARQLLAGLSRQGAEGDWLDAPTFPPVPDLLRDQWEKAAWQNAGDPAAEREAKLALVRWRLHGLIGHLSHSRRGERPLDTEELSHHYEAVLARPDLPGTRLALGLVLGMAGRHAEALTHLRRAAGVDPFARPAGFNLFVALQNAGEVAGARRVARQRRVLRTVAPELVEAEDWFLKTPPAGDELVSILVQYGQDPERTRRCLDSLLRHSRPPWELILVKEDAPGESPGGAGREGEELSEVVAGLAAGRGPVRVLILPDPESRDPSVGGWQALARARGEWVVFLSDGVVLTPGWLEGLLGWATHSWPCVGLVGPTIHRGGVPRDILGDDHGPGDLLAFAARWKKEYAGKALRVEGLEEVCLLARREVLEQCGGFDESPGLVPEDLSCRVRRAGYRLLAAQDVFVWFDGDRPPLPVSASDTPVIVSEPGARARVSLCLIVRNEESNIGACLAGAADLVDEVVVVDTGSTDRTRELAREHGAQVFEFPWVDSFAAARNVCLENATGDYIFWMDADDRLDEANRGRLRELFGRLRPGQPLAWSMKCLCLPGPHSDTSTLVDHIRLFPRHPEIRWRYRVHEQILPALRAVGVRVDWANVVVQHTGYQDPALRRRKLDRDLRLLELERAEHPDDPFVLFNLGSICHEVGRYTEATPLLERSLELSHPKDSIVRKLYALIAQCHARTGQTEPALGVLARGQAVEPDDAELLYLEGLVRKQARDPAGARRCFQALLEGSAPEPHFASVAEGLRGYRARQELAQLDHQEGDLPAAEARWRQVLAERPGFVAGCLGLAEVYLSQRRWLELEALTARLATLKGGEPDAELLRCRGLLTQGLPGEARARAEEVVRRWPDWLPGWVTLSHALLQEDRDHDAAERVLLEILERDPQHAQARHNLDLLRANRARQSLPVGADIGTPAGDEQVTTPGGSASPGCSVALVWEGAVGVLHSLAHVNRELTRRLVERGHEVSLLPTDAREGPVRPVPLHPLLAERLNRPLSRPAEVHVRHGWPPDFQPPPSGRWVLIQPWEFGSLPRAWVDPLLRSVDEVWAYTEHVRRCYLEAGLPEERVHVVPLGVDDARFRPDAPPLRLRTGRGFKFLFVGGTIHRKGIDLLLDVYSRTFTSRDDVCLVIKEVGAGSFYRGQTAEQQIRALQERPGGPEIEYIEQDFSEEQMAGLYTACDCLVHPYRGEGFGLPIAEAMASGLPVIVTGLGAAPDFCHPGNAFLVPARVARFPEKRIGEVETVDHPWLAEPDAEALAHCMRRVVEHRDEAKVRAEAGCAHVRSRLTWEHAVAAVEARLAGLLQRPARRLLLPTS